MTSDIGQVSLILALLTALVQTGLGLWGGHRGDTALMSGASRAALCQAGLVVLAFAALTVAFIRSDFAILTVFQNSHTAKPLIYKIAGVWGNHEGSLLLWVMILAGLGAAIAGFGQRLPETLKARTLGIQGLIGAAFLAFALLTSNPFATLTPAPVEGMDLNPLLQDPGLAFHPPFLYLGYVGFSVAFSFALAALLEGRVDPAWARWVRPWTLLAWTALTIGIGLGALWAYMELGWGGYWFWDPVENASLMPWLAGTALLHSAIVVEKRNTLKLWTVLMAITAFSASLLGAFVVRSGVLTSVHAFANDPDRGAVLLLIFVVLTGGALVLFAWRGGAMQAEGRFAAVSRESALILNNVVLAVVTFTVLIGTFWPLFREVTTGERITVGPPYYSAVTTPLVVVLALVMAAGVMLPWKRGYLRDLPRRLAAALGITGLSVLILAVTGGRGGVMAFAGLATGCFIILLTVSDLVSRTKLFSAGPVAALRRAKGFPRAYWGGSLAHAGVGIAILGMVGTSLWVTERRVVLSPGEMTSLAGFEVRYEAIRTIAEANYTTERSTFALERNGKVVARLMPERRWYPAAEQQTVEAAVLPRWANDIYIAVGEPRGVEDEARVVRLYHHPLALWLWGGGLLMAAGGALSLTDRRYRIGAPAKKTKPSAGVTAVGAAPGLAE